MTSSVVGLRSSKALPKVKLTPKKESWSLFSVLLPIWSTIAFWIPAVKPLRLRSMLRRSMRYTENWNPCRWHCSIVWAQFFSMTMPDWTSHNQRFKSWTTWAVKFCLIHHIYLTSCQPTTTSSSILTIFFQGKSFHNRQEAENACQEFTESQSADFYVTGINKLISCWQKCVGCNGSYFD